MNTAIKADMVSEEARETVLKSMKTINRYARDVLKRHTVHACTDVTGFGLGGHAPEMAEGSEKTLVIDSHGAADYSGWRTEYASMGFIPGGAYRNGNLQGKSAMLSWKDHSEESSENFWLEKTRCGAVENETDRSETIINEAELAAREDIVFDTQTSGGLLLSIDLGCGQGN